MSFVPLCSNSRGSMNSIDPKLRFLAYDHQSGGVGNSFHCGGSKPAPIIGEVRDLDAWKGLNYVIHHTAVKVQERWVVTAKVAIEDVPRLMKETCVIGFEHAAPAGGSIENLREIVSLPPSEQPHIPGCGGYNGQGVVVGIIDFGCDFKHDHFVTNVKGELVSRIRKLWVQKGPRNSQGKLWGRIISREEINASLKRSNPYDALCYHPSLDAHGTRVMDIACGHGAQHCAVGFAPESEIVFVDLCLTNKRKKSEKVEITYDTYVHDAVNYIFEEAGDSPCVINISLARNSGPHDGSSLIEVAMDALVSEKPNRAIVISAGNDLKKGFHSAGSIPPGGEKALRWELFKPMVGTGDSRKYMEVRFPAASKLEVFVGGPGEDVSYFSPYPENDPDFRQIIVKTQNGEEKIVGNFAPWDVRNSANKVVKIEILDVGSCPAYLPLRIINTSSDASGSYHAWIEGLYNGSKFADEDATERCTLGGFATGRKTIVVGSHDSPGDSYSFSEFSSAGPTADGRQKPELTAPGYKWIYSARSHVGGVMEDYGTSLSAPVVTGCIARHFSEALKRKLDLKVEDLRRLLIEDAINIHSHEEDSEWHYRGGCGRIVYSPIGSRMGGSHAMPSEFKIENKKRLNNCLSVTIGLFAVAIFAWYSNLASGWISSANA